MAEERSKKNPPAAGVAGHRRGRQFELKDGAVLIAAITSCTNTSNPT
jgi:aconitate hydratase